MKNILMTTVGELKRFLMPFDDECETTPITIEYCFGEKGEAYLKIKNYNDYTIRKEK